MPANRHSAKPHNCPCDFKECFLPFSHAQLQWLATPGADRQPGASSWTSSTWVKSAPFPVSCAICPGLSYGGAVAHWHQAFPLLRPNQASACTPSRRPSGSHPTPRPCVPTGLVSILCPVHPLCSEFKHHQGTEGLEDVALPTTQGHLQQGSNTTWFLVTKAPICLHSKCMDSATTGLGRKTTSLLPRKQVWPRGKLPCQLQGCEAGSTMLAPGAVQRQQSCAGILRG